jgi:hypothetical protein
MSHFTVPFLISPYCNTSMASSCSIRPTSKWSVGCVETVVIPGFYQNIALRFP